MRELANERWKFLEDVGFTTHHSAGDSTYGECEKGSHCNRPREGKVVKIQIPQEFTVSSDYPAQGPEKLE